MNDRISRKEIVRIAILSFIGITAYIALSNNSLFAAPSQSSQNNKSPLIHASNWQFVDAGPFALSLPPSWKFNKLGGYDSYVGELLGEDAKLIFDYGWWSNPLADDNDPHHVVIYETIDGYRAKIIVPKIMANGITGVYFADLGKMRPGSPETKLEISGCNLAASQQETAFAIFRTIKFKK